MVWVWRSSRSCSSARSRSSRRRPWEAARRRTRWASFVTTLTLFLATVMVAAYGSLGALTATRRPRNPIGWILWVMAVWLAINLAGTYYACLSHRVRRGPAGGRADRWIAGVGFNAALGLGLMFIPLLFPDGRFLSPRWRIVGAYAALAICCRSSARWAWVQPPAIRPARSASASPRPSPADRDPDRLHQFGYRPLTAAAVIRFRRGDGPSVNS